MPQSESKHQGKRKSNRKGARCGLALKQRLEELRTVPSEKHVLGQRVWVKVASYCDWPGIIWSIDLCFKKIIPELVNSYSPGSVLVRFYGDQSSMFCKKSNIKPIEDDYERRYKALKQWGKTDKKRDQKATWALEDLDTSVADCEPELQRMLQLQTNVLGARNADAIVCALCEEDGAQMRCRVCERYLHSLCLTPIALTPDDIPNGGHWLCPSCGEENHVNRDPADVEEEKIERMGLTPDWIIHAGAFRVFQLQEPTPECPCIRGLLDPCTNSKIAPNIPAERLFDKNDDGLKLSNKWEGSYIVLNPDFKAHIQWRFVNRAIDEVENDSVPGVLLICRNSTDTAYFQRLMPYPRVLLRRNSIRFKDYDKTPIGFGIVVFCIVKHLYHTIIKRFMEHFAPFGEPNIVIDKTWLLSASFESLLGRLYVYASQHHRDHWIQCCRCQKWRIVCYDVLTNAKDSKWECKDLNPPYSSCATVQTKAELHGARYAILSEDESRVQDPFSSPPTEPPDNEDWCLEHPITTVPADVLEQLHQMKLLQGEGATDERSVWQACSYTLSLKEGACSLKNGERPTTRQLQALSRALAGKIMQWVPPNVTLPEGGLVFEPVVMDSSTYGTVVQWLHKLTMQTKSASPVKHSLEYSSSIKPKKQKMVEDHSESSGQSNRTSQQSVQVKSYMEIQRELSKLANQRLMEQMYDDGPQSPSLRQMDLQEAENMLQSARQQLQNKIIDEERVIKELSDLEAALQKKCRECDEEYLMVENQMKALQAEVNRMHELKSASS